MQDFDAHMFPSSLIPPHMGICIQIKGNVFCVCG